MVTQATLWPLYESFGGVCLSLTRSLHVNLIYNKHELLYSHILLIRKHIFCNVYLCILIYFNHHEMCLFPNFLSEIYYSSKNVCDSASSTIVLGSHQGKEKAVSSWGR